MSQLAQQLGEIKGRFDAALGRAADHAGLEALRVAFFGRSGEVTLLRRSIGALPPADRPTAGKVVNDMVATMEEQLAAVRGKLESAQFESELAKSIDVTFPAIEPSIGSIHPIRHVTEIISGYFERHGFAVVLGPEVEPDYYNFDALNIPAGHPAREGFDSFWLTDTLLLRPHTSPMQIRTMQQHQPPIAVIVPGKCYRRDAVDARHSYMFHQVEGLLVAEGIHFGHLKAMLTGMCCELFGPDSGIRFRPSYFPFTEPSAEVDTHCPLCKGYGGTCRMCGGSGWIELGGSGMVHPNVLHEMKYDPEVISGWAFGFGVERMALRRYDIDDIRCFFENDPAFLYQLR